MIIAAIVILSIIFIVFILIRNRRSKLPDYLKGKKTASCTDLITEREVYIATHRDQQTKQFIHEAFYRDDGSVCRQLIYRQPYGIMYFDEGNLRLVPKRIAIQLLDSIREGKNPNIDFYRREGKTEKDAKDSPEK
jgi:hypothetical protein